MKRYDNYKDSGVEWIGEIPEHWEATKLKWVLSERLKYGANESAELDDIDLPRYIRITDFGENGKLKDETFKSLPNEVAKDYLLEDGDILFARSGATVGKTFQFKNHPGQACFAGYLIKAKPNLNIIIPDFLYLYTKSHGYESWRNYIFNQATIQNIGADKYSMLDVPIASIQEQTTIATFLDRKTSEIDRIIANKQKLIALYEEEKQAIINQAVTKGLNPNVKLKDSGVEWLGEIPEHWEVKKLRFLSKITTGEKDTENREDEGEFPFFVRSQTVERISTYSFDCEGILTAGDGVGVCKVWHYINCKFDFHQRVYLIYDFIEVIGKFLFYYMKENFIHDVLRQSAKSTVDSLRRPMFLDFIVVFPKSKLEQQTIVTHIDKECTRLDTIISKFNSQIALLQEYRTTLISEVVTGKIKVS